MSNNETGSTLHSGAPRPGFGAKLGTKAFLVIVSAEQFGLLRILEGEAATLGRSKECQIRLEDPAVSTLHSRVTNHPDKGYLIEDCGSTNGTAVNGRKIEHPVELTYGDRISVGSTILRFYLEEIADLTPS